ncbi:lopap-like [Wyeomyia smithii]|uniref:lopap-like n=1 Tax=Wyeomyia smithii TaxID=174621 RepID=UPI00246822AC|nr:lopap-like [Wyeomyia smithii]
MFEAVSKRTIAPQSTGFTRAYTVALSTYQPTAKQINRKWAFKMLSSRAVSNFLLFLALISIAAAVIYEKDCLKLDELYDFKEDQYSGKWYEIRRLSDPDDAEPEDCVQEKYTRLNNKLDFEVIRSVQKTAAGNPVYSIGTMSPRSYENSKVPQFFLRYNTTSNADPDINVDIVKTDYLNYAIVYACNSINTTTSSENAWVLSRHPAIPKHAADVINKYLSEHFTHQQHKWRATEQSETFCKPTTIHEQTSGASVHRTVWFNLPLTLIVVLVTKLLL